MARKSWKQRNAEQRVRSAHNRKTAKATRKPSRDDIARMALWMWIHNTWLADTHARQTLDSMRNDLVDALAKQGFDPKLSENVFEELAERYKSDLPPFRIKRHLQETPVEGQEK